MNKPVSLVQDGKLVIPNAEVLGFDPQEIRRKYDFERDRRLRPDGAAQYQDVDGDLDHYKDDPYITKRIERAPVQEWDSIVLAQHAWAIAIMVPILLYAAARDRGLGSRMSSASSVEAAM